MRFSELPKHLRVKIDTNAEKQLWKTVDEFGGTKQVADAFDFKTSDLYNWRSKDVYLPINFVQRMLGSNPDGIKAIKGKGRSKPLKNPVLPIPQNNELLTRIKLSVKVSEKGVPIYITQEKSMLERFEKLLNNLGEPEYTIYNRSSRYELRYPKFLHQLLAQMEFEQDFAAAFDEKGIFKDKKMILNGEETGIADFDSELHSRPKKYRLALLRNDKEKIADILTESAGRAGNIDI